MTQIIPRSHPRTAHQVPIQYALLNTQQFENSHTLDYSTDGFCYEIRRKLEPETEVCVIVDNYSPDHGGIEAYRSYVARIRWIHLLSQNGSNCYAAGAQIVARSHDVLTTEAQLPRLACDMCANMEPVHRIHDTGAGVCLCRQCLKHFSNIPSEKIRKCVERFLIGNVV